MHYFNKAVNKWTEIRDKAKPFFVKVGQKLSAIGKKIAQIWKWICDRRKLILGIPVAAAAIILAIVNLIKLPAKVGFDLQTDGTFSVEIVKGLAVLGPVAVTALCLLLMFSSKRVLTPWFVSLVSLALPVIILLTNIFPA